MGRPKKQKIGGFTFLEVTVALGIACAGAVTAMALVAAGDYQSAKGRAESGISRVLQSEVERYGSLPYATLSSLAAANPAGVTTSGFLWERISPGQPPYQQLPWSSRASFTTVPGGIQVRLRLEWADPRPGFPRAQPSTQTLQLEPPPLLRLQQL
ncbi:MAG: hypothetical protein RLZZ142_432 [Verrucomicrobiota bacterium]|jgi:type II secretory pathway pseudopilin PulG